MIWMTSIEMPIKNEVLDKIDYTFHIKTIL